MTELDRSRLASLLEREQVAFVSAHSRSGERFKASEQSLFGGVPMSWMRKWPGGFPVVVAEASGARLRDVDGNEYVDLCLGDTGAMAGHGPASTVSAVGAQAARGMATMLPTEDAAWVGDELGRRFGRTEYLFAAETPRTGSEAAAARGSLLEDYLHLAALNRGMLLTPFHNMALMSPATTDADVDRHTEVFRETVEALVGA